MENIIILMLFTYPGAIMDRVFAIMSTKYDYHKSLDGSALAARYLIYSAICTTISLLLLACTLHVKQNAISLTAIVTLLQSSGIWLRYLFLSLFVSIICGIIAFVFHHYILRNIRNKVLIPTGIYKDSGAKDTWRHILNHPDEFDLWNCAVVIYKDNDIVAKGLPYAIPKDYAEGRFALMQCDKVDQELKKRTTGEECLLSEAMLNYYDAANNCNIEFIYAPDLWKKLQGE